MSRTTKLGLWLVPWLPMTVLATAVYTYFGPPYYRTTTKLFLELKPDGTTSTSMQSSSPPLEFHFTWIGLALWICVGSFLVGLVLLLISLCRRLSRSRTRSV